MLEGSRGCLWLVNDPCTVDELKMDNAGFHKDGLGSMRRDLSILCTSGRGKDGER